MWRQDNSVLFKGSVEDAHKTPLFAKIVLALCLIFASAGGGYYLRIHDEGTKPMVMQQVKQAEKARHIERFNAAAAAVADSARLAPGMRAAIYVSLVENLKHPCPLPDEDLRSQCYRLMKLAGAIEVVDDNPRVKIP